MASNGLLNRAKNGKCRMCLRVRCTDKHVQPVGEVNHGFATGYIWQCINVADCDKIIQDKLSKNKEGTLIHETIQVALKVGRF